MLPAIGGQRVTSIFIETAGNDLSRGQNMHLIRGVGVSASLSTQTWTASSGDGRYLNPFGKRMVRPSPGTVANTPSGVIFISLASAQSRPPQHSRGYHSCADPGAASRDRVASRTNKRDANTLNIPARKSIRSMPDCGAYANPYCHV